MNYFFKSGFINRDLTGLQLFNLLCVVINASDIMANIGETGAGDEANVAGTDDRKIHDWGMLRANQPQHKWARASSGLEVTRVRSFILLRT
jgi:hypothetical protein